MNVVEWNIDNFSCWNWYVHEKHIECPGSGYPMCPRILLYPTGREERLVVHIYVLYNDSSVSGQLTFIDSSGSLLSIQDIDEEQRKGDYYELLPKLKFNEVASQMRKKEILHQDRLTLQCNLRWRCDMVYRFYTTIDVCDSTLKIDCTPKHQESECDGYISTIQYPSDDSENGFRRLFVHRDKTIFSMGTTHFLKNILVFTNLSVLNFDSVIRTEKKEHVFQDGATWPFLNSLTREEVIEEGFSLLLRVKVIPSNKYKHRCGYYISCPKVIDALPTNVPEELSPKSLNAVISSNQPENPVTTLLRDFLCLYHDHDFSDFRLRCEGLSIPTHKNILSARSPVFKAMLSTDMTEATSDSMDIPDLDVHTLGHFLVFLYTGTVQDLEWESALKLYYAADKYQVPTLKRECFSVFRKHVSVSNVCEILSLADEHQDDQLTTQAHDFVLKNYNDVLRSEEWKTFVINEPLLAAKTVTNLAEKNIFRVATDS